MGFAQSFWISMDSVLSDPTLEPSYATDWTQWAGAIVGACLVGLTGVLPLWVIPAKALGTAPSAPTEDNLKYLLAFAVGGLLGDVFLHLLPETYQHVIDSGEEGGLFRIGVATLTGVLAFLVLEKVLEMSNPETNLELREKENKKIVGYLNLLANCTDNLLHGLAVGSSFLSSPRLGITTTAAILLHEIPHEFGDFAICSSPGLTGGRQPEHRSALHWSVRLVPSLLRHSRAATISRRYSCISFPSQLGVSSTLPLSLLYQNSWRRKDLGQPFASSSAYWLASVPCPCSP